MSLKELWDHGVHYLSYGGKIVRTEDGDNEYFDLRKDDGIDENILFCDGENIDFEKKYNISTGLPYWYGVTENGKGIYLSDAEYKIAVFG